MTLEQQRAAAAHAHVLEIAKAYPNKDQEERKQYASMAQKLPVLIRSAGLCQAVHFLQSRDKDGTRSVLGALLAHLAAQLRRTDSTLVNGADLCTAVRTADLPRYLWLTREALAIAEWYARLSQSELGVAKGEET